MQMNIMIEIKKNSTDNRKELQEIQEMHVLP
jgi:hypothetical protein